METARILVIGEALMDIVVGPDGVGHEHPGGSPMNVALGLGRLGVPVELLTSLGADPRGAVIRRHLEGSGVRVRPESYGDRPTSTALARRAPGGEVSYEFDIVWDIPEITVPLGVDHVHLGSISAFLEPGAARIRSFLRGAQGAKVSFDPNIRPAIVGERRLVIERFEEIARMSTVVKLSDEDARWLYPGAAMPELLDRLLELGPELVAVTRGGSGAALATTRTRIDVPAATAAVVDTIGAGDTFMASLLASIADLGGLDLDERQLSSIGRGAARAAGITVSRAGAELPYAYELA